MKQIMYKSRVKINDQKKMYHRVKDLIPDSYVRRDKIHFVYREDRCLSRRSLSIAKIVVYHEDLLIVEDGIFTDLLQSLLDAAL